METDQIDDLNNGFVQELLADYLASPESVDPEWRALFESNPELVLAGLPNAERLRELSRDGGGNGAPAAAPALAPAPAETRSRRRAPRRHRGRDVAREGPPDARPPRRPHRPARLGAARRPGARPRPARAPADAGAAGTDPCKVPASLRSCGDSRRGAPQAARDLLRDPGLRARAHLEPRAAALASRRDRVRHLPAGAQLGREAGPSREALGGRGVRAVPAPGVPRPEAVLHRGPRRDGADARRGDRARGRGGRQSRRHRDGAPRAPERPRAHRRPSGGRDPAGVRGRAGARGGRSRARERLGRRQVPPRRRGGPRDAERTRSPSR